MGDVGPGRHVAPTPWTGLRERVLPHPWLEADRRAMLQALGLPAAYVRRSVLSTAELAALQPRMPGERAGDGATLPAETGVAQGLEQPGPSRRQPSGGQRLASRPAHGLHHGGETAAPPSAAFRAAGSEAAVPALAVRPLAAPARLQHIATLDAAGLAAFTRDCRACKLGGLRHQAVFGVGHAQGQVMVVGEAPGAEEDRQGEPFVGAAGKLLDNMLRAVGLARSGDDPARTVYIANVIKCRPPGNRNPEVDEITQCEPILERQIALVRPRLLLALGRFAAQQLTGSTEPIGRLRQRVFQYRGIPVVVSYHPAYLLRTPQDKARAWADLCFAQDQLAVALQAGNRSAS